MVLVDAPNKENLEKTEVNRIKWNGPERVAAAEVKAKNMNTASTVYDNASSPIIDMEISTIIGGVISITKIYSKMFMLIGYFDMVKLLSRSVQYCHAATLYMPTNKLQTFLLGMSKKFFTWHHQADDAFLFLHKNIYGRGYINKRY